MCSCTVGSWQFLSSTDAGVDIIFLCFLRTLCRPVFSFDVFLKQFGSMAA